MFTVNLPAAQNPFAVDTHNVVGEVVSFSWDSQSGNIRGRVGLWLDQAAKAAGKQPVHTVDVTLASAGEVEVSAEVDNLIKMIDQLVFQWAQEKSEFLKDAKPVKPSERDPA